MDSQACARTTKPGPGRFLFVSEKNGNITQLTTKFIKKLQKSNNVS